MVTLSARKAIHRSEEHRARAVNHSATRRDGEIILAVPASVKQLADMGYRLLQVVEEVSHKAAATQATNNQVCEKLGTAVQYHRDHGKSDKSR